MSFQAILYFAILTTSAVISALLSWYTWRHRQTAGAKPFSVLMLILFFWGISYILEVVSPTVEATIFWGKITFLSVVLTPVVWFLFSLEYTGRREWITRPRIIGLLVVPVLTTLVLWTNSSHHWFWATEDFIQEVGLLLRKSDNGFWFWIHAAYSYILILAGTVMVVRALLRWPSQYRGQMAWILFSVFTPWMANAISVFKLLPIAIDLTPFAFTVTGIGMAFAMFRHHLLDLTPIAREVVIEGMQDGMIVLDTNNRIVDINPAANTLLGYSREKLPIGERMANVLTQWPQLIERYRDSTDIKDEILLEEERGQRWIELAISSLQDKKDILVGRLVIIRDITTRKEAEQQVRQLSRAVESSPTSIVITDKDGNIQYVNPKFTQVTGYSSEEVIGKNPNILKSEQTPPGTYRHLWKTISAGHEWTGEFCNRKKNGELYWEIASISPIQDAGGNTTHYVAVKEDITKRKHTENLLQESETRFRLFVENASDFIYRIDTQGYFTYANPAALKVMGYKNEKEVIGKNYLELTTPDARHRLKRTYQSQYIKRTKNSYHEFPAITASGQIIWLGQNAQLLMDGDQVTGFQILARDITEIKHTQDALRIAHDKALEASRAKSQLLARVSHELRTPLGGILGYGELLRDGVLGDIGAEQKDAVEGILQSTQHLTAMVNELLDEAQIQANTTVLQERMFSPVELLQQATAGMEIMAEKKGLSFITFIDPNLPDELYGDDRRLKQMLINLAGNALKFTKEGKVEIRLGCPNQEHWSMQVTDTGIGIPKEAQLSIFEPFQQADNAITSDNRGIGLGLSITKQLVELMSGRIMLESRVGEGSTFSILLPVKHAPAPRN